jgi:hypothetical protein
MSIESPQKPEQTKEAVFQSWLAEFKGRFWLNPDVMPTGVYEELQTFIHFDAHKRGREEEAAAKMEEATANFKKLTGYDIQDFVRYENEQNEKLKADKK